MCADRLTSGSSPSPINPAPKNAGLILLKNVHFTRITLSFSLFFGTLWAVPSRVSSLQTLRPSNKSQSFISG